MKRLVWVLSLWAMIDLLIIAWLWRRVKREESLANAILTSHSEFTEPGLEEIHLAELHHGEAARLLREPDEHEQGDGAGYRNTDEGDEEGIRVA